MPMIVRSAHEWDGERLSYFDVAPDHGEVEPECVVLMHGGGRGDSKEPSLPLAEGLTEHGYRVLGFDFTTSTACCAPPGSTGQPSAPPRRATNHRWPSSPPRRPRRSAIAVRLESAGALRTLGARRLRTHPALSAPCVSAMASLRTCSASQAYYGRKRNEGKGHKQALLALARRRANVLWAMIRDGACYEVLPTVTAAA